MRVKAFGQRESRTRGRRGPAPLQRVSVAQCDHMTAGGRHTPFLTGERREATQEGVQLGWMFGLRRSRQKGRNWAGATPKGQGRPVRPTTAGGRQTPFSTWITREATQEFGQLGRALVRRGTDKWERNGLPQLQRVRVAPCDRRQLEGVKPHFRPGELRRQRGNSSCLAKFLEVQLESVTLQRVSVAQCDRKTAGDTDTILGPGSFSRVAFLPYCKTKIIWRAEESAQEAR
jgi:hypothetical protein